MSPTTTGVSPSLSLPPVSPYGTFTGSLFQYNRNLVAFESSPPPLPKSTTTPLSPSPFKCILIGGLSDGLLATPYTSLLEETCHSIGWSLVQPIFSSSYLGFGNGSLSRDTTEIDALLHYLTSHRDGQTYAIIGHSTGCQNSIHYLKHGRREFIERTKFVALQAPVSDREDAALHQPAYADNVAHAKGLIAKAKGDEMMPRASFWAPITAARFMDLQGEGGADDFFSSDLDDDTLIEKLNHVGKLEDSGLRLLAAYSGKDEYVPGHVDTKVLVGRFCRAMNDACLERDVATPLHLRNANHNLSEGAGDAETFVEKVGEFLEVVKKMEDSDVVLEASSAVGRGQRGGGGGGGVGGCVKITSRGTRGETIREVSREDCRDEDGRGVDLGEAYDEGLGKGRKEGGGESLQGARTTEGWGGLCGNLQNINL